MQRSGVRSPKACLLPFAQSARIPDNFNCDRIIHLPPGTAQIRSAPTYKIRLLVVIDSCSESRMSR